MPWMLKASLHRSTTRIVSCPTKEIRRSLVVFHPSIPRRPQASLGLRSRLHPPWDEA